MELKFDNFLIRPIEGKRENGKYEALVKHPKDPLTQQEKSFLIETSFIDCLKIYKKYMRRNECLSDCESPADLDGESFIFMNYVMKSFDKDRYKGQIGDKNIEGKTGKKTLKFFFVMYYRSRVRFLIQQVFDQKSLRRTINGATQNSYVVEQEPGEYKAFSEEDDERMSILKNGLKDRSDQFKRFFLMKHLYSFTYPELKLEFPKDYDSLRGEMNDFLLDVKTIGNGDLFKKREAR